MVASRDTIDQILAVLRKHMPEDAIIRLLYDLEQVPGNSSFKQTVSRLYDVVRLRTS